MPAFSNLFFRGKVTIQQKLMLTIMLISMLTLLLAAGLFTLFQMREMRTGMVNDLQTLAKVIGNNSQAALAFDIPRDAEKILADLEDNTFVNHAVIYRSDGKLFASYKNNIKQTINYPVAPEKEYYEFRDNQLILGQTIQDENGKLGSIYLAASLDELSGQIMQNLNATIMIILASFIICYVMTTKLQRGIILPIRDLSNTIDKIRKSQDYRYHIDHKGYEEIDNLCEGFNNMLTQIHVREQSLQQLASYDPLTKLPNRKYFLDLLTKAVTRGKRKSHRHALLFLDLDRFKTINDSLGHNAGDNLLIDVAKRLLVVVRSDDTVARLGGDEYTILLQEINNSNQAADIARRIIEVLNEPFLIYGHQVVITPSIGIVIFPEHGMTPENLIKNADTAMYQAKNMGGNNFRFFTEEMNLLIEKRQRLEEELHYALKNDEILLHFQPQINISDNSVVGIEALCRWQKNGKLIQPGEFIPVAEEIGLIIPMTDIILRKAVNTTKNWIEQGLYNHKVSINIAARHFRQKNLLSTLEHTLIETELSPEHLEIEITEAAIMDHTDKSIDILKKIKDKGITIAIDDFGTGYSSLSYLKKFPIDKLKIDKSFIHDMDDTLTNTNIVRSIIELGHNLNLQIVAEGVESHNQMKLLESIGCDILQGYYFSKPVIESGIEDILRQTIFVQKYPDVGV